MEIIYTSRLQPDILLLGHLRLSEPVIFLTDLLMGFVCCRSFLYLKRKAQPDRATLLYQWFFFSMCASAVVGGIFGHLLQDYVSYHYRLAGWIFALCATALLAQASLERGRCQMAPNIYRLLTGLNVLLLIISAATLSHTHWFPIVEMHTAFGLITIVGITEARSLVRGSNKTALYLLAGLPFAIAAVAAHIVRFSPGGIWFNFFDVGHILLCGTFYCFFLGAKHHQHVSVFQ
jgi:hypothetical protein